MSCSFLHNPVILPWFVRREYCVLKGQESLAYGHGTKVQHNSCLIEPSKVGFSHASRADHSPFPRVSAGRPQFDPWILSSVHLHNNLERILPKYLLHHLTGIIDYPKASAWTRAGNGSWAACLQTQRGAPRQILKYWPHFNCALSNAFIHSFWFSYIDKQ